MSFGRPMKISWHERAKGIRRFLKKQARRLRRRAEKRDPENAPKKTRFLDWSN